MCILLTTNKQCQWGPEGWQWQQRQWESTITIDSGRVAPYQWEETINDKRDSGSEARWKKQAMTECWNNGGDSGNLRIHEEMVRTTTTKEMAAARRGIKSRNDKPNGDKRAARGGIEVREQEMRQVRSDQEAASSEERAGSRDKRGASREQGQARSEKGAGTSEDRKQEKLWSDGVYVGAVWFAGVSWCGAEVQLCQVLSTCKHQLSEKAAGIATAREPEGVASPELTSFAGHHGPSAS
ncbi:hypothetical protein BJ742DRAFT_740209 [Cladochytrium replicatum]|nr:hypothetical protein BJ742DRAFT_740209 [Cladochytrium replicatum]